MLYWLSFLSDQLNALNVFRYITVRTGGAMITALIFVFLFGPKIIDKLRTLQGKGQPIRTDGPQSHLVTKKGTPTMGGLMILLGITVATVLWANPANTLRVDRARRDARLRRDRLLRRLSQGHAADPCRLRRQGPSHPRDPGRGGRVLLHRVARPRAVRIVAHLPVLQGAAAAARLVLPGVRRLRHRRRRQRGEPHRRARRARHRAGHHRGAELRLDRLSRRQSHALRLSADPLRCRHRRACGAVRRRDRRGARLPLVQRAAGVDLHGRHRLARARRHARHRSRSPPSTRSCWRWSAGCSCSRRFR